MSISTVGIVLSVFASLVCNTDSFAPLAVSVRRVVRSSSRLKVAAESPSLFGTFLVVQMVLVVVPPTSNGVITHENWMSLVVANTIATVFAFTFTFKLTFILKLPIT